MYADVFRRAIGEWKAFNIRPGDRVRILHGQMTDMTGTVVRLSDRHRCVLRIDGLDSGIRVILPADDLRRSA